MANQPSKQLEDLKNVPIFERVAFLCLGAMGAPMAGHLARAGHDVVVWNRTPSRVEAWLREHEGRRAATPAAAATGARFVFACTGADPDLRAITLGPDGAFSALATGAVFMDHTTASPALARELSAAAATRGAAFLDAPVSGGQDGAKRGALTVMAGGEPQALERARPLLAAYAKNVTWMGASGAGQLTKLVNQICLAGLIQSLAEGLAFAERAGLDAKRVVEVISKGAAQSWQMDHRAETMLAGRFDFGFAVDWMRKDLALALAEATACGARLPVAALVDGFYAEVQRRGGGRFDSSSLLTLLRESR
jgi:3-hydroxyisobutyrate dehydrogenase-like beta-hydroxyacid dehydrogenase